MTSILESPFGVELLNFSTILRLDPRNTYVNAFASYGWLGACSYVSPVLATIVTGWRRIFIRAPWQPYLILAFAASVGVALGSFIIDTDHWRHYFPLVGLVWGLSAASPNFRIRQTRLAPYLKAA
jgi:hypothetical protein